MIKGSVKLGRTISNTAIYVLLSVLGVLWVLPIVYLIYTAFREIPSTGIINSLFPDGLKMGFGNFAKLFQETQYR